MQTAARDRFIRLLREEGVLQFGDFTLKSGRQSPYFFNLGNIAGGAALKSLGEAYASAIKASGIQFDLLFGPAYKGIPIATATAVALAEQGVDVGVAFNRKEAKDHGEGGRFVGAPVTGRVLLVDDVLTAGTALREAVALIQEAGAEVVGVVIAMDRQELVGERTAVAALSAELGVPVAAIVTLADVMAFLDSAGAEEKDQALLDRIRTYQQAYCEV